MDYTMETYYKYNGEKWLILQNGEKIVIAKRSALLKLDKHRYTLLDDSKGKIKVTFCNVSDVDVICLKK